MPTYYFAPTTDVAIGLVSKKDFEGIDKYIKGENFVEITKLWDYETGNYIVELFNLPKPQRVYHIVISAVESKALDVLKHIKDMEKDIDVDYHMKDGNVYTPLHLATENMCKDKDTTVFEFLFPLSKDNLWYTRYLLENNCDLDFIDKIINMTDCDLWDLYHYSIAWNRPQVTEHLITYYNYKVDKSWNKNAFMIARRFDSKDSLELLKNKPWLFGIKKF